VGWWAFLDRSVLRRSGARRVSAGHGVAPNQAQRGDYRVIYRIDDYLHAVTIMAIEHRSDVYRPRQH
jgi:hypothetical protein